MHKRPAAARQAALAHQRVPCGDEHLREGTGVGDRQGGRNLHCEPLVDREFLGVTATVVDAHDEITDSMLEDPFPDGGDPTGELEARGSRGPSEVRDTAPSAGASRPG